MKRRKRILYAGDNIRGEQLRLVLDTQSDYIEVEVLKDMNTIDESIIPDVIILDNFPNSDLTKSVFYHFRGKFKNVLFIALNENPNDLKFIHLGSLPSFRLTDFSTDSVINEISNIGNL
ncbi:MAG: hypothetical protein GY714_33225 [Desulfobacterales bacterium]|nr:hypothetical protein [Desulfobacterales bacterium]MCP4159724.1 hypothetical protein [Deltaproteobacteria bacterium]